MKSKKYGQVQFLLHKNYYEKSLSKEAWKEMVLEIVPFNASADLKLDLIQGCCYNRDINEAAHWARYMISLDNDLYENERALLMLMFVSLFRRHFSIPAEKLPPPVQELLKNGSQSNQNGEAVTHAAAAIAAANDPEDWDNWETAAPKPLVQTSYHSFDARRTPIMMVDTRDKYFQMLTYLTSQLVIAFDAEWKPISCTPEVALIQLATNERVYLIDVIMIDINANEWNHLATHVFNNVEILKLGKFAGIFSDREQPLSKVNVFVGYSQLADLKMFQKTMPAISLSSQMLQSYLDLQSFWLKLDKITTFKFPYEGSIHNATSIALCHSI